MPTMESSSISTMGEPHHLLQGSSLFPLVTLFRTQPPPLKFLALRDEEMDNVNPEFLDWEQQDQLLLSWLLSSMSEGFLHVWKRYSWNNLLDLWILSNLIWVCQFMQNPLESHWKAVKRILRYLSGTLDYGLHLRRSSQLNLVGFCDADWATDLDDKRSTSGYCVFLGENLV
ncbi:putative mitochondrial protein [Vitis vinifera]|uniref:Putative mitochondrial protein n=1 Tax=Vitis vinifera TaxID=29760 RepID=A0A438F3C1_VITVI|nr:putative mitochondrial protein [Vitis vinifera]